MEDLMQDQETIIQQLRLLLAAKEEEVLALKGDTERSSGDGRSDSIADGLLKEIEDKKAEVALLKTRLKETEAKAQDKLARLSSALEEKEALIATLKAAPAQAAPKNEDALQRIERLEEELREKEALLAETRRARQADGGEPAGGTDAEAGAEIERLREELRESRCARANLERAAAERDEARGEAAALVAELAEARLRLEDAGRGHAAELAELHQRIDRLQRALDEAAESAAKGAGTAAEEQPAVLQRIRTLEAELEERDLAYRTTQTKLHRVTQNQQILRGLCAGLCVFLIFIISMKARHSAPPKAGESQAEVFVAARETVPLVDVAKGPAPRDADFLPVPEAEAALTCAETVASAAAPPPPQVADAATAGFAAPEGKASAEEVEAAAASSGTSLPVEMQFVEASTLALGPPPAPVVSAAGRDVRASAGETGDRVSYTVKKGESLWTICRRELGDAGEMSRIARENNIANPNTVRAGDVIYLTRR